MNDVGSELDGIRFSVHTASTAEWLPEETVERVAEAGWDGIEWATKLDDSEGGYSLKWSKAVKDGSALAERTRRAGLEIVGLNFDVLDPDTPQDKMEEAIEVAASFGAPQMRFGMPRYGSDRETALASDYGDLYARAVDKLGYAVSVAAGHGLKLLVECHHGTITPSASLALRVAERFAPMEVGVILDPGNQVLEGFENWKLETELLGDYLAHVHCKNSAWQPGPNGGKTIAGISRNYRWEPLEQGLVDWSDVFQALRLIGYHGWISLEDFSDIPISDRLGQLGYLRRLAST